MKGLMIIVFIVMMSLPTFACTGFYVGKKVSDNGTTIIARTRDSNNMEKVNRRAINKRVENVSGKIYKEINGFEMQLPDTTYKYSSGPAMTAAKVGLYGATCMNEYGLAITATVTAETKKETLALDPFVETGISEACIGDIVAMCCKTSREAVEFLADTIKKYGNAEPNVIMVADKNEAWLIETYTGHEWCAVKMPDDKIAAFGNQFMIDPINEKYDEILYSEKIEIVPKSGKKAIYKNGKFDLFDTYYGRENLNHYDQIRNWYALHLFAKNDVGEYNVHTKYPLFYELNKKIGFLDIKEFYRSRYEGTKFCPDTNKRDDIRIVGTETQYAVDITEIYDNLPQEMCAVAWIALDNAEHSVFIPFSNLMTELSNSWSRNLVDSLDYEDDEIAYYAFQNLCVLGVTGRQSYGKGIRAYWSKVEECLKNDYKNVLDKTRKLYNEDKSSAIKYINEYSKKIQESSVDDARHIVKEVMHYLALNQRTFDWKMSTEAVTLNERYEHPDFKSKLEDVIDEKYKLSNK